MEGGKVRSVCHFLVFSRLLPLYKIMDGKKVVHAVHSVDSFSVRLVPSLDLSGYFLLIFTGLYYPEGLHSILSFVPIVSAFANSFVPFVRAFDPWFITFRLFSFVRSIATGIFLRT